MTYPLERYLNGRSAMDGSFRPDGRRPAFLTDITGTYQVWAVDVPPPGHRTSSPERLAIFRERVLSVMYSPVADEKIFSTDVGGNERAQRFLLSGDGRQLRQLTHAPQAIHSFGGWSHEGRRIAYSSTVRDPCVFDIYILDVPTGEAHLVHRGDGWLYTVGFSPDDTKLLIGKAYSSFNQELWLLDLSNGTACYLTPHLGNTRYEAVFAPDAHRLSFASDLNRDFLTLTHMDLSTSDADRLAPQLVFRGGPGWDVSSLYVAPQMNRLVYQVNAMAIYSLSSSRYPMVPCSLSRACRGVAARRGVRRPREGPRVAGTHLADKPRAPY
jgi:Tol biopolymer transport system component